MSKRDQEIAKLGHLTAAVQRQAARILAEAPRAATPDVIAQANEALERAIELLSAWELPQS